MTSLEFDNISIAQQLFGFHNTHLDKIAKRFGITIHSRGGTVSISGPDSQVQQARSLLAQLYPLFKEKIQLEPGDLDAAITLIKKKPAPGWKRCSCTPCSPPPETNRSGPEA